MPPGDPAALSGRARAVDGDTIELAGERIRLFGIDAPELSQTCTRNSETWACGDWARAAMAAGLGAGEVACAPRERDRYGRIVATCHQGGEDIGEALVRQGAAFAYRRYSGAYMAAEAEAEAAGRGVWAGEAVRPAAFRAGRGGAPPAPTGCAIKGNVSASGRIYHRPGQEHYAATRIDQGAGERWFCSAAEAERAGWRPARR